MGSATGTAKRKCCDCGGTPEPICDDKINVTTFNGCNPIQYFLIVTVSAGPLAGIYVTYSGSTDATKTFNRVDDSDGTTVTLVVTEGSTANLWSVISLVVTDGVDTFTAVGCSGYSISARVAFKCILSADLAGTTFDVTYSGVVNGFTMVCDCSCNNTQTVTYNSGGTLTDNCYLIPNATQISFLWNGTVCGSSTGFKTVNFQTGNAMLASCGIVAVIGYQASVFGCNNGTYEYLEDQDPFALISYTGGTSEWLITNNVGACGSNAGITVTVNEN